MYSINPEIQGFWGNKNLNDMKTHTVYALIFSYASNNAGDHLFHC